MLHTEYAKLTWYEMGTAFHAASEDALDVVLLYRGTCPRCRLLSRAAVLFSGNGMHRVPNDSADAATLYMRYEQPEGKLALVHCGRMYVGRCVFAVVWWAILWCWIVRIPILGSLARRAVHMGAHT